MAQASLRLRAARIAAGYLVAKDAAAATGVSVAAYRISESKRLTDNVLNRAAATFGVTTRYLSTGEVDNDVDRLAARLHDVIVDAANDTLGMQGQGETALRLKEMRYAAGYITAAEACEKFGWPKSAYSTHESGYAYIPMDRLIGYALSLGGRPEYLVLGRMPVLEKNGPEWLDLRSSERLPAGRANMSWTWIRTSGPGLPILTFHDGSVRLSEDRLQLPSAIMWNGKREAFNNQYVYLPPDSEGTMYVVHATDVSGDLVYADEADGGVRIESGPGSTVPKDPTRSRSGGPYYLGGLVRRIRVLNDDGT